MKVKIGISNRHVHLTKDVYEKLFSDDFKVDHFIKQEGEFVTDKVVCLKGPKGMIDNVKVLGPFRDYNQVEISQSDAYVLGLKPPVRKSGDLKGASDIILLANDKEVFLEEACILAKAHIHMNKEVALKYNVLDDQMVNVYFDKERSGMIHAFVKIKDNGVLELHVDRDEANCFLLSNGDEVEVEI